MQEAKRNFVAAMQQLKQEAGEAIKLHHDKIFQDWIKYDAVCFKNDSTPTLTSYGFQQVTECDIWPLICFVIYDGSLF
jgi:hypothetical protein